MAENKKNQLNPIDTLTALEDLEGTTQLLERKAVIPSLEKTTRTKKTKKTSRTKASSPSEAPPTNTYTVDLSDSTSGDMPSVTRLLDRKSYMSLKKAPSNVISIKTAQKKKQPDLFRWDPEQLHSSKVGFERWMGAVMKQGAISALYFERDRKNENTMAFEAKAGIFNDSQLATWRGLRFSSAHFEELFQHFEMRGWIETKGSPELASLFGTLPEQYLALVPFRIKGQIHALVAFVSTAPFNRSANALFKKASSKKDTTQVFKKAA